MPVETASKKNFRDRRQMTSIGLKMTAMQRWIVAGIVLICACLTFAGTVDPPMRVHVVKLDKTELNGLITAYSDADFDFMDPKKQTSKIQWNELPPDVVFNLNDRLMTPRKASADDWFKLGKMLLTMPGGRGPGERAFARAVHLDPKLKDQIAAARKEASLNPPKPATQDATSLGNSTTQPAGATTEPASRNPFDPRDPQKKVMGPQNVGAVDASTWGKQSPEQMAAAVTELKAFADQTQQTMGVKLKPYETQYFLFYSDLPAADAQKWASVLDRMYGKLSLLFGVPAGENLWHGKALVFVFAQEIDYQKFELKMHKTMAAGTAGMCHTFGGGDVHIAFYRQPNDMDFAHVLVHESVHGFVHRYRSPVDVPSWANEGLAETIATDMVPQMGIAQSSLADARSDLQSRKSLDDFFTTEHIVAWQYPVARTLTEFMIRQSKTGYVEFINGIKDGLKWDESLKTKYGVTPDQLVTAYGNSMGVAGVASGIKQ